MLNKFAMSSLATSISTSVRYQVYFVDVAPMQHKPTQHRLWARILSFKLIEIMKTNDFAIYSKIPKFLFGSLEWPPSLALSDARFALCTYMALQSYFRAIK